MKAKKALKRLKKVETILSNVIDHCPVSARGLLGLLDSARSSVVRAKGRGECAHCNGKRLLL